MKLMGKFTTVAIAAGGVVLGVNIFGSTTDTLPKKAAECIVKDRETKPGLVIYKNTCSVQLNTFSCGTGLPDPMEALSRHFKDPDRYWCREDTVEASGVLFSESVTKELARSESDDVPSYKEILIHACYAPKRTSDSMVGIGGRGCR